MNENQNISDQEILDNMKQAEDLKKAKNALVGFGIIFAIGFLGGKFGATSAAKVSKSMLIEMQELVNAAEASAELAATNADITFKNGQIIFNALKQTTTKS